MLMKQLQRLALPLLGLIAGGLMLAIGLVGAPGRSTAELVGYLAGGGVISVALAAGAWLWLRRGRGPLWLQMTLTYAVGVVISLANILLTVRAMLLSDGDLPLLVLLLLFAGVISLGLGVSLAHTLMRRLESLRAGTEALAAGDLQSRVKVGGNDELAELAAEFNQMAAQLDGAATERARQEGARRELVAAVSHDLRTPLASIRAMVEALSDGLIDDPATSQRYFATMRAQVDLLSGLIDDLFELSRIDAGALALEFQQVSLAELLSDTLNGLRPQALARGVELCGDPGTTLGTARVATQKIERVLYNLGANAIRHTVAGGQVIFRAARLAPDAEAGERVLFEVIDTGEGIAPEDLPHVFERFYRGEKSRSRATGGAGLGLAIARGIVEAHGGRIWLESERGHGTTVRFTLPG